jgi:catechol 2,3-dioxygenase-like lactoylglutathione lyase family enzyme
MLKFAHVGIVVHDMDLMEEFYAQIGFKQFFRIRRDEPWIGEIVDVQGADIEIVHMASPKDECRIELLRYKGLLEPIAFYERRPYTHFCMWTDSIASMTHVVTGAGGHIVSTHVVTIPDGTNKGTRVCYFSDPEGNMFELMQRPVKVEVLA